MPEHDLPPDLLKLADRSATPATVEIHSEIDSTNRRALELAEAGEPHGTFVIADRQVAGRGRRGRTWRAQAGEGILLSVVVRVDGPDVTWGWLPLVAAVAVARTVEACLPAGHPGADSAVRVKWPNDVLVHGRKVAGILVERRTSPAGESGAAVVGIGLNVNQERFSDDLADRATSLRLGLGRRLDRADVARRLVGELLDILDDWKAGLGRSAYRALLIGVGEPVEVRAFDGGETVSGTLDGIDEDGCLCIRTAAGMRTLVAGDVTLRRA